MLKQLRIAAVCFLLLTLLTGTAYPLLVTAIARGVFPGQATGSMRPGGGGSTLIGQSFDDPRYFWGRPSATTDANGKALPYNAASSSGSNLGPTNPALVDAVKARVDALHAAHPGALGPVPVDLVTSSASGLDPHISPAAAEYQVHRVATARNLDEARVRALVERYTEGRQFGVLGEPRVNVLSLNHALDEASTTGPGLATAGDATPR